MDNDKHLNGHTRFFLSGYKDSYLANDVIAHGGMGIIYDGTSKSGQKVIIKQSIYEGKNADDNRSELLKKEAKILKRIVNRNIVSFMDESPDDNMYYYVMEKISGPSLMDLCLNNPPDLIEGTRIMVEVCDGVKYLHDFKIIHRDLNPKNIMMDGGTPVIIDFSSAEILQSKDQVIRLKGSKIGTPIFSAPEQFENGESSTRSDIYSVGMCYLFILTGQIPVEDTNQLHEYVSRKVLNATARKIILSCTEKDPDKRIGDIGSVQEALLELVEELRNKPTSRNDVNENGIFLKINDDLYPINGAIGIGRNHDCNKSTCGEVEKNKVSIDNPFVSRHHILLKKDDSGRIFAKDLGSKNGTAISGDEGRSYNVILRGQATEVYVGDIIALGYKQDIGPKQIIRIVSSD